MTLETTRAALEDQLLEAGAEALPIQPHRLRGRSGARSLERGREGLGRGARLEAHARRGSAPAGRSARHRRRPARHRRQGLGVERAAADRRACPRRCPKAIIALPRRCPIPSLPRSASSPGATGSARYKTANDAKTKRLVLPEGASRDQVLALAEALYFGRDLINTPANDLGPAELEAAARELANAYGGSVKVTEGSGLLSDNFPMIHAVGRASDRAPAADRSPLRLRARAQGHHRRQGHLLRHRRPRHQAVERHGADEEGHGRRRRSARLRAPRHARQAAGPACAC